MELLWTHSFVEILCFTQTRSVLGRKLQFRGELLPVSTPKRNFRTPLRQALKIYSNNYIDPLWRKFATTQNEAEEHFPQVLT